MCGFNRIVCFFTLWLLISVTCRANDHIVDHYDPITIDAQLTLSDLINFTLANYPDGALLPAMKEEAEALQRRGDSWIAGAPSASFFYRDGWVTGAAVTGSPEFEGAIEVPLWNWGQRSAGGDGLHALGYAQDLLEALLLGEVQRGQRRTEPAGTCGEHQVLHGGKDRAVVRGECGGHFARHPLAHTRDDHGGHLGHALGQVMAQVGVS